MKVGKGKSDGKALAGPLVALGFLTVCLGGVPTRVGAATISSYSIISSPPAQPGIVNQIRTTVADNGNGTVTFHFENVGAIQSSITEIYFQDGPFLTSEPVP